jgi:uncharacterized protein (DUF1501 family)
MSHDIAAFSRRGLLALGSAASLYALGGVKFALAAEPDDKRLIVILLRGGVDGLSVLVPYGDPAYARARRQLALSLAGGPETTALKLDGFFGLNDAMSFVASEYRAGAALGLQAVATPYRERSHFDAQNMMETGAVQPYSLQSGWLNRAVSVLAGATPSTAVAITPTMPTLLIGPAKAGAYSAGKTIDVGDDTLERVMRMYANDPQLSAAFSESQIIKALAETATMDGTVMQADAGKFVGIATTAAKLMRTAGGPRIAVLERGGWDTHAGQPVRLRQSLKGLDAGLAALKAGLGPVWAKTAVLCLTEFGRTVAVNGTNGTDHGTASIALLLGGAVNGGRVLADWPGLSQANLYQGRDLKPTADMRTIIAGILHTQLGLSETALMTTVFPGSAGLKPMLDLMRR